MSEDADGKWRSASKMHFKRGDFAVFAIENTTSNPLQVPGQQQSTSTSQAPNFETLTISDRSRGDTSGDAAAQNVNDELMVCGGLGENNGAKALQQCEILTVSRDSGPRKQWKTLPALPDGRGTTIFIKCDGYMYL